MLATVGQEFTAQLAVAGDPGFLGARVEVPVTRAIASAWTTATVNPETGAWEVTLDAPVSPGEYLLVWRTGDPEPPDFEVFVPLTAVTAAQAAAADPAGLEDWRPTTAEVGAVVPSYTRGGFDDDDLGPSAGAEQMDFDESTSPTKDHVEGLIDTAQMEIAGRVAVPVPLKHAGLAQVTTVWHVAMDISGSKRPADTDDSAGEYRTMQSNYVASLNELIRLARMGGTRLH